MPQRFKVVSPPPGTRDVGLDVEHDVLRAFPDLDVEVVTAATPDPDALVAAGTGAAAILTSSRDAVTREVLEKLPELKVVGRYAVGFDNIDTDAATDHGVIVTHYPDYCTSEVADHAMTLMLALNRRVLSADRNVRAGEWGRRGVDTPGVIGGGVPPMDEQTVGIIGFGRIGHKVRARLRPFGSRVIVSDPYIDRSVAEEADAELVPLPELLERADIVTIHCPLNRETRRLIGTAELARLKSTAYLVNTARGPLVDVAALYDVLAAGKIAGAALDVFDPEPMPHDSPYFSLPNVILTPHSAYYSDRALVVIRRETFHDVVAALAGHRPRTVANPAVLTRLGLA